MQIKTISLEELTDIYEASSSTEHTQHSGLDAIKCQHPTLSNIVLISNCSGAAIMIYS